MTMNTTDFVEANQLQQQGRLESAIALYYQAIEFNPDFSFYYYN